MRIYKLTSKSLSFVVLRLYLGYIVNEDGLKTDDDKVKPILEYPAPFNVRQLRRFLGMIGWYSRFIAQGRISNIKRNPKKYPDWKVVNGLPYANRPNKTVDPLLPDVDAWKLVLAEAHREKALSEAHNIPQSGHLGVGKTFARVATYYYWPG